MATIGEKILSILRSIEENEGGVSGGGGGGRSVGIPSGAKATLHSEPGVQFAGDNGSSAGSYGVDIDSKEMRKQMHVSICCLE